MPAAGLARDPRLASTTAPPRRSAWRYRTAYHTLRSVARIRAGDEVVVLGAGGGVGLAAVQLARATRRHGHRRGIVGREARRAQRHTGRDAPDQPPRQATCATRCAKPCPTARDAVVDPVGGAPVRARAALTAARWPVRHRRLRLRRHPAHPAEPGAGRRDSRRWASSSRTSPRAENSRRNEDELRDLLRQRRGCARTSGRSTRSPTPCRRYEHVADGRAIGKILIDVS